MRHRATTTPTGRFEVASSTGEVVATQHIPSAIAPAPSPHTTLAVVPFTTGDVPAWLPQSRAAFEAALAPWDALATTCRVAIWPVAEGAISDIPSTLTFLRGRPAWGLILDPAALLTPGMVPNAEEHLSRIAEALARHPALLGLIVPSGPLRADVERVILPALRPGAWVADSGTA